MHLGPQQDTHAAVRTLDNLRGWSPFKYWGRWYVAEIKGIGYAYRTMPGLLAKSRKEDPTNARLTVATVEKQ